MVVVRIRKKVLENPGLLNFKWRKAREAKEEVDVKRRKYDLKIPLLFKNSQSWRKVDKEEVSP